MWLKSVLVSIECSFQTEKSDAIAAAVACIDYASIDALMRKDEGDNGVMANDRRRIGGLGWFGWMEGNHRVGGRWFGVWKTKDEALKGGVHLRVFSYFSITRFGGSRRLRESKSNRDKQNSWNSIFVFEQTM